MEGNISPVSTQITERPTASNIDFVTFFLKHSSFHRSLVASDRLFLFSGSFHASFILFDAYSLNPSRCHNVCDMSGSIPSPPLLILYPYSESFVLYSAINCISFSQASSSVFRRLFPRRWRSYRGSRYRLLWALLWPARWCRQWLFRKEWREDNIPLPA